MPAVLQVQLLSNTSALINTEGDGMKSGGIHQLFFSYYAVALQPQTLSY